MCNKCIQFKLHIVSCFISAPNPCLETPSLCTTEIGKYCVPDDSVAGYACQCRDYDGFIANSDGSCTGELDFYIVGVSSKSPILKENL